MSISLVDGNYREFTRIYNSISFNTLLEIPYIPIKYKELVYHVTIDYIPDIRKQKIVIVESRNGIILNTYSHYIGKGKYHREIGKNDGIVFDSVNPSEMKIYRADLS